MIFLVSCGRFLDIPGPQNQLLKDNVFTDEQSATAAIVGIYSNISTISSPLSATMHLAAGLSADVLVTSAGSEDYQQLQMNAVQANNQLVAGIWTHLYQNIYYANAAIEGLQVSTGVNDSVKTRLTGEALFIRAWCYYYLVNFWGDVPLTLNTDYEVNQSLPRFSKEKIYDQIITDLSEAQNLLSQFYLTGERTRPNSYTASALLARVNLNLHDWASAAKYADAVIESGRYKLVDPAQVFLKGSEETIWQLMPVFPNYNTIMGQQVLPSSPTRIPRFILSDHVIEEFEIDDLRKETWVNSNFVSQETYYFPYKYKIRRGSQLDEYLVVFRLAEQYLIRAEAKARLGDFEAAKADLNRIRNRAGLQNRDVSTQSDIISAVERERLLELFTEWGDRWLYLKQAGRADEVLGNVKNDNWQNTDVLWPLPYEQMQLNPFLTQNMGY